MKYLISVSWRDVTETSGIVEEVKKLTVVASDGTDAIERVELLQVGTTHANDETIISIRVVEISAGPVVGLP